MIDLTERIKKIIAHYNITSAMFADRIGVQRSSISHILSGRNKPSLDFVLKVVEGYPEVDLYWLLHGKGSFPSSLPNNNSKSDITENRQLDLTLEQPKLVKAEKSLNKSKKVTKIVLFYEDGSFEMYNN